MTLDWRFLHVYTHLISLITSKQSNQVSFKPLSSTWPTYDTKSMLSALSNAYILNVQSCSLDWLFWFQCVIRETRSLKHSGKIEATIQHQAVHLRMKSGRRTVGQLIIIKNLNAEMIWFYSYPASGFFKNCPKWYSSLCILPLELSAYTQNPTALLTQMNKFHN